MSWWKRLFGRGRTTRSSGFGDPQARTDGPQMQIDLAAVTRHAQEWTASRRGVEGYVEPATSVTATTIVLIAHDGEWTRRAVGTPKAGFDLARQLEIPVYDVNQTGYPSRMREWSRRNRG